jgi:phosphatidylserine/phosphatidylglycerophosphate/cardiolipin synthase-like enzyme
VGRTKVIVELGVKTPHGAAVQGAFVRVISSKGPINVREKMPGLYRFVLSPEQSYEIVIDGPKQSFEFQTYRGILQNSAQEAKRMSIRGPSSDFVPAQSVLAEEIKYKHLAIDNRIQRQVLDVVLDYKWFTPIGFPPTLGNRVELLIDGEDGWAAVARAIAEARKTIRIATWVYDPQMELLRPDPVADPAARVLNTIHRMLQARAAEGVLVQLLLWDPPLLPLSRQTLSAARTAMDGFEVLSEKNPTQLPIFQDEHELSNLFVGGLPIGSYHQKTVVCDGKVGFCGGMNLKQNDWDTRLHRIFDPARCRFSRPRVFRQKVRDLAESSDHPPRHDFMARIEGPSVAHLEENFRQRWNRLLDRGVLHAENSTRVDESFAEEMVGTSAVQVVRTMPEPYEERGILDVWLRAIKNATKLIYIEDQYFRSVAISEAIALALQKKPDLQVIAITSESHANQPITGQWSRVCFDIIRAVRPEFELHALHVVGTDCRGNRCSVCVDNHGKLLIVDDTFLMVGSCNVNDRGLDYEGECNLAIVDPEFVARARQDLFHDYLDADPRLGWSLENDVRIFHEHAEANRKRGPVADGHPFVVPFIPRPRKRLIFHRRVF